MHLLLHDIKEMSRTHPFSLHRMVNSDAFLGPDHGPEQMLRPIERGSADRVADRAAPRLSGRVQLREPGDVAVPSQYVLHGHCPAMSTEGRRTDGLAHRFFFRRRHRKKLGS